MIRRVRQSIRRHRLCARRDRVLAAVSGGADSVAMLAALRELARPLGIRLAVAHFHHGIRGPNADADARFVRRLAGRLRIRCVMGRADVPQLARRRGLSLEMAAREARYAFLARAARKVRASAVATAHTADDQAETVLLKLTRGAGAGGLAGIARSIKIGGLQVIRPMLDVTRRDVIRFLRERRMAWREDESNRDLSIPRNRVRRRVLPFLERELNPGLRTVLVRTADVLREEDAWLDWVARKGLESCAAPEAGSPALDASRLRVQPVALIRRVIRLWLVRAGVPAELVDYEAVDRVESLLAGKTGTSRTNVAGAWIAERRYNRLEVRVQACREPRAFRARVKAPGETLVRGTELLIRAQIGPGLVKDRSGRVGAIPAHATIRRSALGRRALVVRSWRPGDRMAPLGMTGSRKLQDIFTDGKVPVEERRSVPVFECAGRIVWIPGYRVARGWEVLNPRETAVHVRVEKRT
ncbi:MAG: tRNA lysidine(34) synthetase TilS [Verrucomicrobiota bacterium]|nr:tRNA lysidine(34) synthetase TilS [Verrucomicrobiota bacterium]